MKLGSTQPSRSYLRHVCLLLHSTKPGLPDVLGFALDNLQRGPIQPTTMLLLTKPAFLAFRILLCHPTNFLVQC